MSLIDAISSSMVTFHSAIASRFLHKIPQVQKDELEEKNNNVAGQYVPEKVPTAEGLEYLSTVNSAAVHSPEKVIKYEKYILNADTLNTIPIKDSNIKISALGDNDASNAILTVYENGNIDIENNGITSLIFHTKEPMNINILSTNDDFVLKSDGNNNLITTVNGISFSKLSSDEDPDEYNFSLLDKAIVYEMIEEYEEEEKLEKAYENINIEDVIVAKSTLSSAGTVEIDGVLYENGQKAEGKKIYNGVTFINGQKANGLIDGILYKDGTQYLGAHLHDNVLYVDGMKSVGKYVYNDILYIEGEKATKLHVFENVLYIDGLIRTGKRAYKERLYINGIMKTGVEEFEKILYINGRKSNKTMAYDNKLFINGVQTDDTILFDGILYVNGERAKGVQVYNGDTFINGVYQQK